MPSKSQPDEEIGHPLPLLCSDHPRTKQLQYFSSVLWTSRAFVFEIAKGDFTLWDKVNAETCSTSSQLNCKLELPNFTVTICKEGFKAWLSVIVLLFATIQLTKAVCFI